MSVCVSELMERSVKWVHVLCRLDRFFLLLFDTLVYALESFDTKREREGEWDKNQTKILRSITQKCVSEKLIGVKWEKHKSLPPFSSYIGLMGMRNGGSLAIKWIITLMHNVRYSFVLLSLFFLFRFQLLKLNSTNADIFNFEMFWLFSRSKRNFHVKYLDLCSVMHVKCTIWHSFLSCSYSVLTP